MRPSGDTETHRGDNHVAMEAADGANCNKPRNIRNHGKLEETGRILRASGGSVALPTS